MDMNRCSYRFSKKGQAMKAEEKAYALKERYITTGEAVALPFEGAVSGEERHLPSLHTAVSVIIKALFLAAWAYGLFQGGLLGLLCILCGIIVLAVTTLLP